MLLKIFSFLNLFIIPGWLLTNKGFKDEPFISRISIAIPLSMGIALTANYFLAISKKMTIINLMIVEIFIVMVILLARKIIIKFRPKSFGENKVIQILPIEKKLFILISIFFIIFFLYNSFYYGYKYAWVHFDQLAQTIFPSEMIIRNEGIPLPIKPLSDMETNIPFIENLGLFYPPFNYLTNVYFSIFDKNNYDIIARSQIIVICIAIIGLFYSHAKFNKKYSWPITLIILTSFPPFILFSSVFQGEILILLFTILFVYAYENAINRNSISNAIIAGLAVSFGCLSKQWMVAIYPIIFYHLYGNKESRYIIFVTILFTIPGLIYLIYSQIAVPSPSIPMSTDFFPQIVSLIKFAIEFPIYTNFNYDLEGWGPLILFFAWIGLCCSLKNRNFLLESQNLIATSGILLYICLYFIMPSHVTPLFFAGYYIIATPALVFLTVDGYSHLRKLCSTKMSQLLLNILFITMALYTFGYSFLGGGNNFTYTTRWFQSFDFKAYSRLETIKIIHPEEYEYLNIINQLNLNNNQRILSASNFELATVGVEMALTPARYEIIDLRYINNNNDMENFLMKNNIKYLLVTKINESIWMDLESKFVGYNILLKKLNNDSNVKIIFENKIAKVYQLYY